MRIQKIFTKRFLIFFAYIFFMGSVFTKGFLHADIAHAQSVPVLGATLATELTGYSHDISQLAFSEDGNKLSIGAANEKLAVWNLDFAQFELMIPGSFRRVTQDILTLSPHGDAALIYTEGEHKPHILEVRSLKNAKVLMPLRTQSTLYCAAFSPQGDTLAAGYADDTAKIWNIRTGKALKVFRGKMKDVEHVAFSADGKYLATVALDTQYPRDTYRTSVKVWNVKTGKELYTLYDGVGEVRSAQFSPHGTFIATTHGDGKVRLWDTTSKKVTQELGNESRHINVLLFTPDGRHIITGENSTPVRVWDVATAKELFQFKLEGSSAEAIALSPSGSTLAVSGLGSKRIQIWDVQFPR